MFMPFITTPNTSVKFSNHNENSYFFLFLYIISFHILTSAVIFCLVFDMTRAQRHAKLTYSCHHYKEQEFRTTTPHDKESVGIVRI